MVNGRPLQFKAIINMFANGENRVSISGMQRRKLHLS